MIGKVKDLSGRLAKCGVFTVLGMLVVASAYRQARYEEKLKKNKKRRQDVWF